MSIGEISLDFSGNKTYCMSICFLSKLIMSYHFVAHQLFIMVSVSYLLTPKWCIKINRGWSLMGQSRRKLQSAPCPHYVAAKNHTHT